jgi:glycosyltransferase involved in cell wall biosynthesis
VKPVKRLHLIVEALAALKKLNPDIPLVWTHLGGGPGLEELKEKAKTFGPSITCYFTGDVTPEQIVAFYRDHPVDVFVNVSSSEGLPVSIMEAMSTGIPVLATDVGGVRELVDDSCGKLVPADVSIKELAESLLLFRQSGSDIRKNAVEKWKRSFNQEANYPLFLTTIKKL